MNGKPPVGEGGSADEQVGFDSTAEAWVVAEANAIKAARLAKRRHLEALGLRERRHMPRDAARRINNFESMVSQHYGRTS